MDGKVEGNKHGARGRVESEVVVRRLWIRPPHGLMLRPGESGANVLCGSENKHKLRVLSWQTPSQRTMRLRRWGCKLWRARAGLRVHAMNASVPCRSAPPSRSR